MTFAKPFFAGMFLAISMTAGAQTLCETRSDFQPADRNNSAWADRLTSPHHDFVAVYSGDISKGSQSFEPFGFAARHLQVDFFSALMSISPQAGMELMTATFSVMDLVFYAIAAYEGFKFSIVQGE